MTILYWNAISNGQGITLFFKVLAKWRGSIYKLVWIDLIVYVIMFYIINFIYRFALPAAQKREFERLVMFCQEVKSNIPVDFLLGFFVAGVISYWYQIYLNIPSLNRIAFIVDGYVTGGEPEKLKKVRLLILRYMNLAWILLMRQTSDQITHRFKMNNPDDSDENSIKDYLQTLNKDAAIQATYRKIITEAEIHGFEGIANKRFDKSKKKYIPEYWIPLQWASTVARKAFLHGYMKDTRTCTNLIYEIDLLRNQMQNLTIYMSIMIPLVYTQVVVIAVYTYFLIELFGSQFLDPKQKLKGHDVDFYIPIFAMLRFLFLMGWLKVAMCVMNPFGDDDEDFQTSDFLDENLDVTYRMAINDPSYFPDDFQQPVFNFPKQEGYENDLLHTFMDDADGDMEDIEDLGEDDVDALAFKSTRCGKLKSVICCKCDTLSATMPPNIPPNGQLKSFFEAPKKKRPARRRAPSETDEVQLT